MALRKELNVSRIYWDFTVGYLPLSAIVKIAELFA
jgi:hypothetical protein